MKKNFLLSVLAGLMVVGSAVALPSPEDRKALCEKHPEKYVWVEKTKACIPINPCLSSDVDIRNAYCISTVLHLNSLDHTASDTLLERYIKKVLKQNWTGLGLDNPNGEGKIYGHATTSDGGYFVVKFEISHNLNDFIDDAFWAYGYSEMVAGQPYPVSNQTECEDIADFASLIAGNLTKHEYDSGSHLCYVFDPEKVSSATPLKDYINQHGNNVFQEGVIVPVRTLEDW